MSPSPTSSQRAKPVPKPVSTRHLEHEQHSGADSREASESTPTGRGSATKGAGSSRYGGGDGEGPPLRTRSAAAGILDLRDGPPGGDPASELATAGPRMTLAAGGLGPRVPGESIPRVDPSKELGPRTRRLVDTAQIRLMQDLEDAQLSLELRRKELQLGARQLRGLSEGVLLRARPTLSDAVREDERLSTLPPKKVLQELAGARSTQPSPARAGSGGAAAAAGGGVTLESFVAATKRAQRQQAAAGGPQGGTEGGGPGEARRGSAAAWPEQAGADVVTPGATAAELLSALRSRWEAVDEATSPGGGGAAAGAGAGGGEGPSGGPGWDSSGVGAGEGWGPGPAGGPSLAASAPAVTLDDLVSALRHEVPAQEEALRELKQQREHVATKLGWARRRNELYDCTQAPDEQSDSAPRRRRPALDELGREVRAMAMSLVDEILDNALRRLAQRPSREQVVAEVAAWRQEAPGALGAVARQLAEGLVHEVVDRMIGQAVEELDHLNQVADSFSFDLLVEAVAFSQRKYQFGAGADNVRARLRDAAAEQDAKLARGIAARRAAQHTRASNRQTAAAAAPGSSARRGRSQSRSRSQAGRSPGAGSPGRSPGRASPGGGGGGVTSDEEGGGGGRGMRYEDEEDDEGEGEEEEDPGEPYNTYGQQPMGAGASHGIKVGASLDEELDEEAIYVVQRDFDDTAPPLPHPRAGREGQRRPPAPPPPSRRQQEDKQLYLEALKAMLREMRTRRGDAPFGHTQQLSVYWPPYVRVTRAQRLATQRLHPPLAAGPPVWRHLAASRPGGPLLRAPLAPWPGPACEPAAARERAFWAQVALRPSYLTARNTPMMQIFKELGPITATCASPNGVFLAVGTAPGVMMVFDMRGRPVAPWFQVHGDGHTYKRPPWFRRRRKPRNPALVAFAWSSDSYQLASLDASSTLRLWWMRPEPGSNVKEDPVRQPVAPELAISLGPLSVALTGKAPVLEPLWEEAVAAAAAAAGGGVPTGVGFAAGAAAAGGPAAAAVAAAAAAAALSRRWCVCFHPDFNIAGVQPTVLLPQITGDLVKLTTTMGGAVLPTPLPRTRNPPRPPLSPQAVAYLMPPQLPCPESRSQALLRGHDAHVVFVGVLGDCAGVVSVDMRGAVHLWPTYEGDRSGYGWFRPRRSWQLPRTLRSYQARGPLHPVWPRVPVPALRGVLYNPPPPHVGTATGAGGPERGGRGPFGGLRTLLLWRRRPAAEGDSGASDPSTHPTFAAPTAPAATFADLLEDAGLLDDEAEPSRLDELPLGEFLLEGRQLWLVRFLLDRNGRLLREAIHRPAGHGPAGGASRPLLVSTYTMAGELVRRAKQYVVHTQLPYRVVAADLTPSRRDLVVWCHVAAQAGDVDSFGYYSVHVLNFEEGLTACTPRIEIYDHSRGASPPAFAVSPRVGGLGSEYLVVGLAHGLLGFFSLGTGAIVRVVQLPGVAPQSRYFSCLSLYTVSPSMDCPNAGKSFVAVTPVASTATHVFLLDDEAGVHSSVGLLAALSPPPGAAIPPPPEPIMPPSREPEPLGPLRTRWVPPPPPAAPPARPPPADLSYKAAILGEAQRRPSDGTAAGPSVDAGGSGRTVPAGMEGEAAGPGAPGREVERTSLPPLEPTRLPSGQVMGRSPRQGHGQELSSGAGSLVSLPPLAPPPQAKEVLAGSADAFAWGEVGSGRRAPNASTDRPV